MRIPVRLVLVAVCGALAMVPAAASAADCTSGTTAWTNSGGGAWKDAANWSNGVPTASCDAVIDVAGSYGVVVGEATGSGGQARSLTIGGGTATPTLIVDDTPTCAPGGCTFDRRLVVGEGGITIGDNGTLRLVQGDVATAGAVRINNGRLEGDGSVSADAGAFQDNGTVAPTTRADRAAQLRIVGDFSQDDGGIAVDVPAAGSGTTAARLVVTGTITLNGYLEYAAAAPARTDPVRIVSSDTDLVGRFQYASPSDQDYDLRYTGVAVDLMPAPFACTSGTTTWTNQAGGQWSEPSNWSRGAPTDTCDARITAPGNYGVAVGNAGSGETHARSLVLGGNTGYAVLRDSNLGTCLRCFDTTLHIGSGGITVHRFGIVRMADGDIEVAGRLRLDEGSLTGYGSIKAAGGVVNHGGNVVVDENPFQGGPIDITGDYTQSNSIDTFGTLSLTLPLQDSITSGLRVSGTARLGGTLEVDGDRLVRGGPAVQAGAVVGRFKADPNIFPPNFTVKYAAKAVLLVGPPVLSEVSLRRAGGAFTLRLRSSRAAQLIVALQRREVGRVADPSSFCVAVGSPGAGPRHCTRYRTIGTSRLRIPAGLARRSLRLHGLVKGNYRLRLVAIDSEHRRSRAATVGVPG